MQIDISVSDKLQCGWCKRPMGPGIHVVMVPVHPPKRSPCLALCIACGEAWKRFNSEPRS